MNERIIEFTGRLPHECRTLGILPGHRMTLQHMKVGKEMWVVLLTTMPGDHCRAWRMPLGEYWHLKPRYGSRDRFIRENIPPVMEGGRNPEKARELSLF